MEKTIVGRIDGKTISETIQNYQANIPEQELTAKKNICNKFAAQGYNPKDVIFWSPVYGSVEIPWHRHARRRSEQQLR